MERVHHVQKVNSFIYTKGVPLDLAFNPAIHTAMHWRTFNRRLDQIKRVDAVAMADAGAIPYAHVRGEHLRIPHIQAGSAT